MKKNASEGRANMLDSQRSSKANFTFKKCISPAGTAAPGTAAAGTAAAGGAATAGAGTGAAATGAGAGTGAATGFAAA